MCIRDSTQCGLAHANPTALTDTMRELGIDPQRLIQSEGLGNVQGLMEWLGAFSDVHINVREVVDVIRTSPFLPEIPVHGLVIDIETGKLEMITRG